MAQAADGAAGVPPLRETVEQLRWGHDPPDGGSGEQPLPAIEEVMARPAIDSRGMRSVIDGSICGWCGKRLYSPVPPYLASVPATPRTLQAPERTVDSGARIAFPLTYSYISMVLQG